MLSPLLLDEKAPLTDVMALATDPGTDTAVAWEALRVVARTADGYPLLYRAARQAQRLMASPELPWRRHVRIAVLGGALTSPMTPLLRFFLAASGIRAEIYEAPFGQMVQELLGPSPELQAFAADIVLLAPDFRETRVWQAAAPGPEAVAADVALCQQLWSRVRDLGAVPIQQNFEVPDATPLGNLDGVSSRGHVRWLRELNLRLADAAEGHTTVLDIERVAARVGASWYDERYWFSAKQAVAPAGLPALCRMQAHLVRAVLGLSAKVLALDLDNTVWGGVVGEDGVGGLELNGTARGEAFVAFQAFCRDLRRRGVLLVVVSKNNEADALQPFAEHAEMVLQREDFSAFCANWRPKSENLRAIAAELDLGLEAFVFFDDNPAERAEVRARLPEVTVIDVPEDPAGYVRALAHSGVFEIAALTTEDLQRADDYRSRQEASALQEVAGSTEGYLAALAMTAVISPFRDADMPRIAQLVQKTNQFNLTTRRHTEGPLRAFMASPAHLTLTVRLSDRFGDRGLVAVVVGEIAGADLVIDTWLMSCRVLGRTVEALTLQQIVAWAQAHGLQGIVGEYRPTAKNGLVQDLYPGLGFTPMADADGASRWYLSLQAGLTLPETYVMVASGVA